MPLITGTELEERRQAARAWIDTTRFTTEMKQMVKANIDELKSWDKNVSNTKAVRDLHTILCHECLSGNPDIGRLATQNPHYCCDAEQQGDPNMRLELGPAQDGRCEGEGV